MAVRTRGFSRLNVRGHRQLEQAIKECWSHAVDDIVVQRMVDGDRCAVVFPHPTRDGVRLVESSWGMFLLAGFDPDLYTEADGAVTERIGTKEWFLSRDTLTDRTIKQSVLHEKKKVSTLAPQEVRALLDLHRRAEEALGPRQAVEVVLEKGRPFILQVTTMQPFQRVPVDHAGAPLATGEVARPGVARGTVKVVRDASDVERIAAADVLVTDSLRPEYLTTTPAGIVVRAGSLYRVGKTAGVPALRAAIAGLADGQEVVIDAFEGAVYAAWPRPAGIGEAAPEATGTARREAVFVQDAGDLARVAQEAFPNRVLYRSSLARITGDAELSNSLARNGLTNVTLVFPFSSPEEVQAAKATVPLPGVLVDRLATLVLMDEICAEGVSLACFDLDALGRIEREGLSPAVRKLLAQAVAACRSRGVETAARGRPDLEDAQLGIGMRVQE